MTSVGLLQAGAPGAPQGGLEEAERLWPQILERAPLYGKYRAKTRREIPLVLLERR